MAQMICPYCPQRFASYSESQEHIAARHEVLLRSIELEPLEIGTVSERARDTAETLLEAFYLQDEREAHLVRENTTKAASMASTARDLMRLAYEREFPHLPAEIAHEAGDEFIQALLLHDEIENWEFISQLNTNDELADILQTDTTRTYGNRPANDPRWKTVKDHLRTVCRLAEIDGDYAEKQTQFWKLHGQIHEYWEVLAHEAHQIKLRAMIPVASEARLEQLAQYFVAGVKLHDSWGHQYKDRDLSDIVDLVGKYYQLIFELREQQHEKPTERIDGDD